MAQLLELIAQKDDMEQKIEMLTQNLSKEGVGAHGSLVDEEGFPKFDFDKTFNIRTWRNELGTLQTDYVEIMKKIESGLEEHFKRDENDKEEVQNNHKSDNIVKIEERVEAINIEEETKIIEIEKIEQKKEELKVFCKVNSVMRNSPAEQAGLLAGDEILSFGSVNYQNHNNLLAIRDIVIANENKFINISLLRSNTQQELKLKPGKWQGNGLLGCHILPI